MPTNEIIWISYIFINYAFIIIAYRLWGKAGLLLLVPLCIVLANIQVNKLVILFGLEATLGNIAYGGIFLIEDILSENYGKQYAKKIILIGFFTLIFTTIVMNIALYITPADFDTAQEALKALFTPLVRLTLASVAAYCVSTFLDAHLYQMLRKIFSSFKTIAIRNNISTMLSQMADSVIFVLIAFLGVYESKILISIMISTYVLKLIISVADTPFVYLAAWWKKKDKIKEII